MKITASDFKVIEKLHPKQRGNVSISNLQVLSAILYVAEHGCKWRGLPKRFGNWHTIYKRANRWAKRDVLGHVFAALQEWDWRFKKNGPQSIGKSPAGWTTKIHMVAAEAKTAVTFSLSHGQAGDPPEGCCRKHLKMTGGSGRMSLWTKPTKGDETRQSILALEMLPVVPPKSNRLTPWDTTRKCTRSAAS